MLNRLLGIIIVLLLLVNLSIIGAVRQQVNENRQQIALTYTILTQIENLVEGMALAQRNNQSYLLTGNQSFLDQYQIGVQQVE